MAYKQRSNGLPFKQVGSSPAKNTGIFDYRGGRLSTKQAQEMEDNKESGWENIKYTENDAIKKAELEASKATTAADKAKWLKEASAQTKSMSERMTDGSKFYESQPNTNSEEYFKKHTLDAELQASIEDGTYEKGDEPTGFEQDQVGYKGLDRKDYQNAFPTEGFIRHTREQ